MKNVGTTTLLNRHYGYVHVFASSSTIQPLSSARYYNIEFDDTEREREKNLETK